MKKILTLTCIVAGSVCSFAQTGNYAAGTNAGNTGSFNYNTSVGHSAGDQISSSNGSYFGYEAGGLVTSGAGSFFGFQSGKSNSGSSNSFFGYKSGPVTTGSNNVFAGHEAGLVNTSGASSVFLGYRAGYTNTSGGSNTFIGYRAGYSNVTGTGNILIGANAGYSETGSNKLYIQNSSSSTPLIYGNFSTNQVGINTTAAGYTLNVGGSVNATSLSTTSLTVGGVAYTPSLWNTSGSNINYTASGIVSIGTTTSPTGFKLAVGGKIIAEEIVVKLQSNWPDYVFKSSYDLMTFDDLRRYIQKYSHLPNVPAAEEVAEKGISLGEMNSILLKKIEEQTLYILQLEKRVTAIENK